MYRFASSEGFAAAAGGRMSFEDNNKVIDIAISKRDTI
jgi:hypothetical protein